MKFDHNNDEPYGSKITHTQQMKHELISAITELMRLLFCLPDDYQIL